MGLIWLFLACSGGGADDTGVDTESDTDLPPPEAGSAVLNEVLTSNSASIVDEASEHEDWIEIYNPGRSAFDLSGWALTDRPDDDSKVPWPFPAGTSVPAGEYLIVWADEQPEQGPLHTSFKISRDGESVALVNVEGEAVDRVDIPVMEPDHSYARVPDRVGDWQITASPTPAASNGAAR